MIDTRGAWRAAVLYTALTILFAYPLSVHPGSTLFGDNPDTHFYIWSLSWDAHAFLHQPLHIFDANIYYPNRLTLAYSENEIGSAFIAAPILWLTGNHVLAVNLTALIGCILCGVGAYVLARTLGLDAPAATLCGLVFAFAPARFARTGQAYLGTLQWIPFALAGLHAYFAHGDRRALRLAAAFFSLEALTSGHGAVFLALAAGVLLLYRFALGEPLALRARLADVGIVGLVLLLPAVLVYLPYRAVQAEMGLRRALEDWAPAPESFLAAPTHLQQWVLSWLPGLHVHERASANLFPGYLPIVLTVVAVMARMRARSRDAAPAPTGVPPRSLRALALLLDVLVMAGAALGVAVLANGPLRLRLGGASLVSVRDAWRPLALAIAAGALRAALTRRVPLRLATGLRSATEIWRRQSAVLRDDATAFYLLLTLVSIWLSLGPPLGVWPLVYWLPGLSFIRVPSRFMLVAVLGLAVLSAIGFDRLAGGDPRRRARMAVVLGVLLVVEFAGMPLQVAQYQVSIPAIDRWLATRPVPFSVAEFPTTPVVRSQTTYMLHAMAHWQKTVHGFSGFEAPLHTRLYQELRGFPDDVSLQRLRDLRVTYAVVHEDAYRPDEWAAVRARLDRYGDSLTLERAEGAGRIYAIRPARPSTTEDPIAR